MRISDWSSDVCSSDLLVQGFNQHGAALAAADADGRHAALGAAALERVKQVQHNARAGRPHRVPAGHGPAIDVDLGELGRAPCRERVCQYVLIPVVPVYLNNNIYITITSIDVVM